MSLILFSGGEFGGLVSVRLGMSIETDPQADGGREACRRTASPEDGLSGLNDFFNVRVMTVNFKDIIDETPIIKGRNGDLFGP